MDESLKPKRHITKIDEKVSEYFKRYSWLKRKYFTPKSLLVLIDYFIKSRLMYGMCLFMETKRNLDRLNKTVMRHIVHMLGLPNNTSHDRLRIILGEPDIETKLAIRLLKIYHKYKKHFSESPEEYRNQLLIF